jgi:hypothetical protein
MKVSMRKQQGSGLIVMETSSIKGIELWGSSRASMDGWGEDKARAGLVRGGGIEAAKSLKQLGTGWCWGF